MTHVKHIRKATILLGDDSPLTAEAEYETNGKLAALTLTHTVDDTILGSITVCELECVEKLVYAILAVLPAGMAADIQGGV